MAIILCINKMFFAATREREKDRCPDKCHPINFYIDSNKELNLGRAPPSTFALRKSIDIVYPEFSSIKLDDLIRLAEPEEDDDLKQPQKKLRHLEPLEHVAGHKSLAPEADVMPNQAVIHKIKSLDDLVLSFPQLEKLIEGERAKQALCKVPMEYVREHVRESSKPHIEPKPLTEVATEQSVFSFVKTPSENTEAVSAGPLTPAESVVPKEQSGSLLAGIDDLFSGSRKTKSKSRR